MGPHATGGDCFLINAICFPRVPKNSYAHVPESLASFQFCYDGAFGAIPRVETAYGRDTLGNGLTQPIVLKSLNREKQRADGSYATQSLVWRYMWILKEKPFPSPWGKCPCPSYYAPTQ